MFIENKNIVFRADASERIGLGHVMRCLALAQAWQDNGGKAYFVMSNKIEPLEKRLLIEGIQPIYLKNCNAASNGDATFTVQILKELKAKWVIVDGYHFKTDYQKKIKESNVHLLVLDDYCHVEYYYADIILNRALNAEKFDYSNREPYTKLLLGPQYSLFRREFNRWAHWQRVTPVRVKNVLVTLGGSDPDNTTLKVIYALKRINQNINVKIVLGSANKNVSSIRNEVKLINDNNIELCVNVSNMAELMKWADIAVTAPGTALYEMVFMKLPNLSIRIADNQPSYQLFSEQGLTINAGDSRSLEVKALAKQIDILMNDYVIRSNMVKQMCNLFIGAKPNLIEMLI